MDREPTSTRSLFEQLTSAELEAAAQMARDAHARLAGVPEQAADYQKALNAYLQAIIRYMSIVNVFQARQQERLIEEVADLKAKVDTVLPERARP